MKLTKVPVTVMSLGLILAACYWTPPQAQSGGVSLTVTLPRAAAAPSGVTFRAYLYDSTNASLLYWRLNPLSGLLEPASPPDRPDRLH